MRVLYATDGGPAARDAGRLIELLADREATEVVAASVVATGVPELRHLSAAFQSDDARRQVAKDAVDEAVATLGAQDITVDGVVREGRPAATLLELASEHGVELIVVGSGMKWFGGRLLGSVSTGLLHTARTSVLVVHTAPSGVPGPVVVGVDGSDHAARALDVATAFLDPERCAVTVVSAAKLMAPALMPPYTGYATVAPSPEIEAEVLAPSREHADRAAALLRGRGFAAETAVMLGHPVKRLLAEVDDVGAALVVVGSRGLDALDRAAVGSVSDQVVRYAPATLVGR
ncbi:MAG TPA: universal stress protein [Euzebyales bacterium]|nr:universal stress protein [Euzebyales bacterium]